MKNNNIKTAISPEVLKFRHHARRAIRDIFDRQGFLELETPYLLHANTPDPYIDPIFASSYVLGERKRQLHTSPEIWLKKGLSLGLRNIYQMAKVFRDDPIGRHHHREFTMLEWYRVGANLPELIADCEDIFLKTFETGNLLGLIGAATAPAFKKTDLNSLFWELADIDLENTLHQIAAGSVDHLQNELVKKKADYLPANSSFSDAFCHVMLKYIEPNLPHDNPVVISRWPIQLAALAAPCDDDPNFCDRFEIYFEGLEIANAYQECADSRVLRDRFISDNLKREALGKPVFTVDESFLTCMANVPKTAGIALGIDRLFLAVLGKNEISEVVFGFEDQ